MNKAREDVYKKSVDLILNFISLTPNDGSRHSFMCGPHGCMWPGSIAVTLFYKRKEETEAALFIREHGPSYLRSISISKVKSIISNFITSNFYPMANSVFMKQAISFASTVPQSIKDDLVTAISKSEIFEPRNILTLFPLGTVNITPAFSSNSFVLTEPATLNQFLEHKPHEELSPESFPPIIAKGQNYTKQPTVSWLGIYSPNTDAAKKIKAAILGAIALTPHSACRYMFSGRQVFGGMFSIHEGGGYELSYGSTHTPPLMHNITLKENDHSWLKMLSEKLSLNEKSVRRQIKALEYFYRPWRLSSNERFPWLCMSLDALYGDANQATLSVISAIQSHSMTYSEAQLKLLHSIRGDVIHGRSPDVYDSKDYQKYYIQYGSDPVHDLEKITVICLRKEIFGDNLREHIHPEADILKAHGITI